jgi:transcriptional regulator with XRE-family HTH domain
MPKKQDPPDRLARLARIERLRVSGEAREIRLRAGVSARELGRDIGVASISVLRWEENEYRPRPELALRWLDALDRMAAEAPEDEGSPLAAAAAAG